MQDENIRAPILMLLKELFFRRSDIGGELKGWTPADSEIESANSLEKGSGLDN